MRGAGTALLWESQGSRAWRARGQALISHVGTGGCPAPRQAPWAPTAAGRAPSRCCLSLLSTALGSPQMGIPLALPRAPLLQVEGREWEKLVLQAA